MKTLILILMISVSLFAIDIPRHTTTYHDTTVTTQVTYIETENGYISERSTHREVTAPRRERERRDSEDRRRGALIVTRVVSAVTGCVMIGLASNANSKANEYKELQGMSDWNNLVGFDNGADYRDEIERYERQSGIFIGTSALSFGIFGVSFTF